MQEGHVVHTMLRQIPGDLLHTTYHGVWWRGEDSNLRRHRRQIYSLFPLAAREPLHGYLGPHYLEPAEGLEPPAD